MWKQRRQLSRQILGINMLSTQKYSKTLKCVRSPAYIPESMEIRTTDICGTWYVIEPSWYLFGDPVLTEQLQVICIPRIEDAKFHQKLRVDFNALILVKSLIFYIDLSKCLELQLSYMSVMLNPINVIWRFCAINVDSSYLHTITLSSIVDVYRDYILVTCSPSER